MSTLKLDFIPSIQKRYQIAPTTPCCDKDNKDGKFAPFKWLPDGSENDQPYGKCHSCGTVTLPKIEGEMKSVANATQNFVDPHEMERSRHRSSLRNDTFYKYLAKLWNDETAMDIFMKSNMGTSSVGTVYWLVDRMGRICQSKRWECNPETGSRGKNRMQFVPTAAEGHYPCAFNELEAVNSDKVIGFVESEKTAVLCNHIFPELVWVGVGGATNMSADKARPFAKKNCLIFFDADEAGREGAIKTKEMLRKQECVVSIVDLWPESNGGFDLADFIGTYPSDEDKLNTVRKQMKAESDKLTNEKGIDYSAGIVKVESQFDYMLHTFRNGKKKGETTHMKELDKVFKWKRTFLTTVTGYPNSGKSEFLLFSALLKAKYEGRRWQMFVPESMSSVDGALTVDEVADTLIHTYIGKTTDPHSEYHEQMSEEEYKEGMKFVNDHFTFIFPKEGACSLDDMLEYAQWDIDNNEGEPYYGIIIDPWNDLLSTMKSHELLDDYVAREIVTFRHFLMNNDLVGAAVVHPTKAPTNKDGSVPPANANTLRGGASFYNKSHAVISVHRPDWYKEKVPVMRNGEPVLLPSGAPAEMEGRNSTLVEIHTWKMKNQKLVGVHLGKCDLDFNKASNRYSERAYNGITPFDEAYRRQIVLGEQKKQEVSEDFDDELPF